MWLAPWPAGSLEGTVGRCEGGRGIPFLFQLLSEPPQSQSASSSSRGPWGLSQALSEAPCLCSRVWQPHVWEWELLLTSGASGSPVVFQPPAPEPPGLCTESALFETPVSHWMVINTVQGPKAHRRLGSRSERASFSSGSSETERQGGVVHSIGVFGGNV